MKRIKNISLLVVLFIASVLMLPMAAGAATSDRVLPASVDPGATLTVSMTATDYGSGGSIVETLPDGFTYDNSTLNDTQAEVAGNTVTFTLFGESSFDYTVNASGTNGTYVFSGIIKDFNKTESIVTGDTSITVGAEIEDGTDASAVRALPVSIERGEQFTVGMSVADYGANGTVMETLPPGFTYDNSTLDPSEVMVEGNMVTFNLTNETSFEYTVMASMMEGDYTFSGIIKDEEANESPVGGNSLIEVLLPDGILLHPGWNYISVPYVLDNPAVASVMEGVTYDALIYYNAVIRDWGGPVSTIEPLKAYWINVPVIVGGGAQIILEENLEPMMPATPSFIMVYEGWNSIGYTDSTDTLSAELTLASIDDSYTTIVGPWDPAMVMYDYVGHNDIMGPISGKHVGTDVFEMNPYEGYWVYATEDGVLNSIGM